MPYGPSVPHMFIVVFVIMLPIYLTTSDPIVAWTAGLAWSFIIGIIVLIGAFVGPYIRRYTPQAAHARHARRHLDRVHLDAPGRPDVGGAWIALPVFAMLLIGFFTDVKLPFNIPDRPRRAAASARRSAGSADTCRCPT